MGNGDYTLASSRIGKDGASSIVWQGACDAGRANWIKADQAIIAGIVTSAAHTPSSQSFQLRWRNFTDNPTGPFVPLSQVGELQGGVSAGCITNTDPVGDLSGCTAIPDDSEEVENENPLQTASLSCAKNGYIETQWCVDFSNALSGKKYEFEIYDASEGASCGILLATITTETEPCLPQTNSRIANASESWQGVCDQDIVDWVKTNDFILSTYATGGSGLTSFKLQWKVAGGSFADVASEGAINYIANTSLINENIVGTPAGCLSSTASEESEGDNVVIGLLMGASSIGEMQWALDISAAADGTTYEFQLVCTTDATSEVCSCSITTAAGDITAYKDITLKTSLESALTYKDITLKTSLHSLDYKDITLKTSLSAAPLLGYKDITLKTTLESALTYKDITLKTTLESALTYKDIVIKISLHSLDYKDIALKTTLESIPIYKDVALKISLNSAPFYKDITLKTTLESALTYKDITLKTTLESIPIYKDVALKTTLNLLNYKDVAIKTSLELGEIQSYKDITLKTTLESALSYKDVVLKTSLHSLDYKDITLKISLDSLDYKDITLKTTLESALTYKDITLKTTLESIPIYKDISLKTTLNLLNYKDVAIKTSLESLAITDYKDITLKISLESALTYKDISIITSLESALTYKDISLKTSFRLEQLIGYKDIALKISFIYGDFKDISIKVSLEIIPKEIINFTSSINQTEEIISSINQTEEIISSITQTENFIANINT